MRAARLGAARAAAARAAVARARAATTAAPQPGRAAPGAGRGGEGGFIGAPDSRTCCVRDFLRSSMSVRVRDANTCSRAARASTIRATQHLNPLKGLADARHRGYPKVDRAHSGRTAAVDCRHRGHLTSRHGRPRPRRGSLSRPDARTRRSRTVAGSSPVGNALGAHGAHEAHSCPWRRGSGLSCSGAVAVVEKNLAATQSARGKHSTAVRMR